MTYRIRATLTSDSEGREVDIIAPQLLAEREDLKEAVDFLESRRDIRPAADRAIRTRELVAELAALWRDVA